MNRRFRAKLSDLQSALRSEPKISDLRISDSLKSEILKWTLMISKILLAMEPAT